MIWTAVILGLVSSLHCMGMCGPIALAVASSAPVGSKIYTHAVVYNVGRVATYAVLGLLFGFLGQGLLVAGMQQKISIISGVVILLLVLLPRRWKEKAGLNLSLYNMPFLKKQFGRHLREATHTSRFMTGLLNGLLPCGMVYIALAASLAQPSVWSSVAYMVVFGLGTFPSMFAAFISGRLLKEKFRLFLLQKASWIAGFVAVLFIFRGLALGIPYLSPEVTVDEGQVKAACCEQTGIN